MRVLLLLLIACGSPQLQVANVDPAWEPVFLKLQADLKELGYETLINDPSGIAVLVDAQRVVEVSAEYAMGFWDPEHREVVLPPIGEWITYPNNQQWMLAPTYSDVLLAHELGHAMGLHHTVTGLMAPGASPECIGRAAECLLEALTSRR